MSLFSMLVVFILIWWVTLFAILPIGVQGQAESGEVVKGSEPGAPVKSEMKKKFMTTTIVTFIIWAIICTLIFTNVIKLPADY